jgi:hypothetical protein
MSSFGKKNLPTLAIKENHLFFSLPYPWFHPPGREVLAAGSGFWNKAPQIYSDIGLFFLVELVRLW